MELFAKRMLYERKKRRNLEEDELEEEYFKPYKKSKVEDEEDIANTVVPTLVSAAVNILKSKERKQRIGNKKRESFWWESGYINWSEEEFKLRMRVNRETFHVIANEIGPYIQKTPSNFVPLPITVEKQVAVTIYRLAHGSSFSTISDLFGISIAQGNMIFNKVVRNMVKRLYDRYVKVPCTDQEWERELRGFIENYEFPCVGAWDGFHVYIETKLKSYFSFKKRYTMSNMGLIGYNKRFLDCAVGAPGSTHDARMLRKSKIYKDIQAGRVLPEKGVLLEDGEEIPLVTIGDSAFPKHQWLLKTRMEC